IGVVAGDNVVLRGPAPGPIFGRRRDKAGALVVLEDPRSWLPFSSPDFADLGPVFNDRIWFVVNLTRGTVLAKSCDDIVALTYATRQRRLLADLVTGGERFRVTTRPAEPTDQVIGAVAGGIFDITTATQTGLYRSEVLTPRLAS